MNDRPFASFASRFQEHAAESPGRRAVVCDGTNLTYAALLDKARACASRMQSAGLVAGGRGRVGVIASNSPDYTVVIVACQLAGIPIVPLPCLIAAESLARMLDDANVALLFHDTEYAPLALDAVRRSRRGADMIVARVADAARPGESAAGDPSAFVPVEIRPDWESDLIYSSGTTGTPKGISQHHAGRVAQSIGLAQIGLDKGSGVYHTVGQYSNFGMIALFLTLWCGGTYFVTRKFSGAAFLANLASEKIDLVFAAPATLIRMLETPGIETSDRRRHGTIFSSGAPLTSALKERVLAVWGGALLDAYGQTETGALTMLRAREVPADKLGSVGKPLPTTSIRIIDEAGSALPIGAEGEIVARTPTLMSGYHANAGGAEDTYWLDEYGHTYVRTGDIGRLDADGYLWLCDRRKDMIISGGFNVYPADIERVIQTHPAVSEVAVVGGESARWGETPVAFLTLRDGRHAGADELRTWINERVGAVQRVAAVRIVPDLPRGSLGKILKRELRDQLARTVGVLP